jgi:trans-2,3-dihydro-3-hydroxyanthranilate isomerase
MRYRFYTADVFTDRAFRGNPLVVFPHGPGLSTEQMHRIARDLNLSETVFVFPAQQPRHTRRLRIFTPSAELPFAGHPTIGTAHVLASIGEIVLERDVTNIVLEEGVGPVPVRIRARDGRPVFAQLEAPRLPEFGPPPPSLETIAATLSLSSSDLGGAEAGPQAVSCGVPFLFVPVRDKEALRRVRVNREQWERSFASYWAPHLYVFVYDAELSSSSLRARMFAPALGIEEDPATGAAATALAGYLGARDGRADATLRWRIEQGFEMGRPSILDVEADKRDGAIISIRVGGASVLISEGTMEVPELA